MKYFFGIITLCVLAACTPAKNKGTFVFCAEGSPSIFNPQLATDGATFNASSQPIYNRLIAFKPGTTEVKPSLAESWDISDDGLEYSFYLRRGVKFHQTKDFTPSREFNADDVLFTFNRQRDEAHPYHLVSGGTYEYFKSMEMDKIIKDIIKVDNYTVKFILSRKEAPFIANLAMDFASILSKEYADQLEASGSKDKIDNEPIGTGPFVFKRYIKDTLVRYESHKNYFEGPSKIKKLVFAITPDANVRFQKLKTGECHFVGQTSPTDLEGMRAHKKIKLLQRPGMNVGYLAFNTQKIPFKKLLVRRAIYHALNRKSYIEAIYLGYASVAESPLPPVIWGYHSGLRKYEYNIKKAKALLKKAGYPKGFETTLWTLPITRPYNPNGKKMGELMQSDLARVGIKVNLVTYDWPTYLAKINKGEHDLVQLGWTGDNGDPDNFLGVLLSCAAVEPGSNAARWCNNKFSALIIKAKQVSNVGQRSKIYKELQVIFKRELPWVPIAHSITFKAMRSNVYGYIQSPLGTENFYPIEFK